MSRCLPDRPFVVNDVAYRPFGLGWLRGVTPARLAVLCAACACYTVLRTGPIPLARNGIDAWYALCIFDGTVRNMTGALPLLLLFAWTEGATATWPPGRRARAFAAAILAGAVGYGFAMWGIASLATWRNYARGFDAFPWWFLNLAFQGATWGGLGAAIAWMLARARAADRLRLEAQLQASSLERGVAEARLQLLRAQIEPHFLFNTLASVKRLQATEPSQARELIRNLRRYLADAIPGSRVAEAALGDEVDRAGAYLEILQVRMGDRLRIEVDVADELRAARVPPLMLGTLVENAVKHGLAPRGSGGRVRIEAAVRGEALLLRVVDDGVGFRAHSGRGVGLANTRARLRALYGEGASLGIRANPQGGVSAEIVLPHRGAAALRRAA